MVVSIAILLAVVYQLRNVDFALLRSLMPVSVLFWVVFVTNYFFGNISEWIIFRRLWTLPVGGFSALLRKMISNELLLGYSGEVYFYAWARRNAKLVTAPFGAVKDVAILSALTGNVGTLILALVSAPLLWSLNLGVKAHTFFYSAAFVMGTSFLLLLFRRSVFSLPREELWFVTMMHSIRIVVTTFLSAVMWHLLLPSVDLNWWLILAAMRLLLSRLPLIPNKDVVFAGLATFLVGEETGIVAAMTLMASLIFACHLLVGVVMGVSELLSEGRKK
jgi:hypothetical protein